MQQVILTKYRHEIKRCSNADRNQGESPPNGLILFSSNRLLGKETLLYLRWLSDARTQKIILKTSCHSKSSDNPHCQWAWIIQSYLPGSAHMYCCLIYGFLGPWGVCSPNGISINSAVSVGLVVMNTLILFFVNYHLILLSSIYSIHSLPLHGTE